MVNVPEPLPATIKSPVLHAEPGSCTVANEPGAEESITTLALDAAPPFLIVTVPGPCPPTLREWVLIQVEPAPEIFTVPVEPRPKPSLAMSVEKTPPSST